MFDTDIQTFLMDRWDGSSNSATNNSWEITLAELLNFGKITNTGMASGYTITQALQRNLKNNGAKAIGTVLVAQVANSMLKKSGLYRMVNKTVRMVPPIAKMVKF